MTVVSHKWIPQERKFLHWNTVTVAEEIFNLDRNGMGKCKQKGVCSELNFIWTVGLLWLLINWPILWPRIKCPNQAINISKMTLKQGVWNSISTNCLYFFMKAKAAESKAKQVFTFTVVGREHSHALTKFKSCSVDHNPVQLNKSLLFAHFWNRISYYQKKKMSMNNAWAWK